MYTHPELGLRLARTTIEEARARAQRASALRAASVDQRSTGAPGGTRRYRWPARALATVSRSPARPRSLRADASRTTKG
jgi:hypothetical protein